MQMLFALSLLIFCQEVHSDERTGSYWTTDSPVASSASTTTAASLYCDADKCDRHSILIYDLEQKFKQLQNDTLVITGDLRGEVEILKEDNEDLNRENKMMKEDLRGLELEVQALKEENGKLKIENEVLKEDVNQLQGLG